MISRKSLSQLPCLPTLQQQQRLRGASLQRVQSSATNVCKAVFKADDYYEALAGYTTKHQHFEAAAAPFFHSRVTAYKPYFLHFSFNSSVFGNKHDSAEFVCKLVHVVSKMSTQWSNKLDRKKHKKTPQCIFMAFYTCAHWDFL